MLYIKHFWLLVLQVIYGKAKKLCKNVHLCFLHLTLSYCAGIGCQCIEQEGKYQSYAKLNSPQRAGSEKIPERPLLWMPRARFSESLSSQLAMVSWKRVESEKSPERPDF